MTDLEHCYYCGAAPGKCPKCGAAQLRPATSYRGESFECGSYFQHEGRLGLFYEQEMCLRNQLAQAKAENERLREIADRLPTTADGVIVWPGMRLWYNVRVHPEPLWIDVDHWCSDCCGEMIVWGESQHELLDSISLSICYSSHEAASEAVVAAKEKET